MRTMTRTAVRRLAPAASNLRPPSGRPGGVHRPGRSSQVSVSRWALLACGATALVGLVQPALLPWLLVPAVPALLLWEASDALPPHRRRCLMRVFSAATLAAIAVQLVMTRPWIAAALTTLAATLLFLVAAERIATTK